MDKKILILVERITVALENIAVSLDEMNRMAAQSPMMKLLDLDVDLSDAGQKCKHPNQPLITTGGMTCPDCGAAIPYPDEECKHPYYNEETKACGVCGNKVVA